VILHRKTLNENTPFSLARKKSEWNFSSDLLQLVEKRWLTSFQCDYMFFSRTISMVQCFS